MPQRDIKSSLNAYFLMNEAITTDTNTDSAELDMANYDSGVKINAFASAYSAGTYTVQLHASDTTGFTPSASTLLATDEIIPSSGTIAITAVSTVGDAINSLGVCTAKRYLAVRIVSTSTGTATIVVTAEAKPELRQEV